MAAIGPELDRWWLIAAVFVLAPPLSALFIVFRPGEGRLRRLGMARARCRNGPCRQPRAGTSGHIPKDCAGQERCSCSALKVTLHDTLQPIAEELADMQTIPKEFRRERAIQIAQRCVDGLRLVLHDVQGLRAVVYRVDEAGDTLRVIARGGRSESVPGDFVRGDERGDAAFATLVERQACFVRDVDDAADVANRVGAHSGARRSYRTFIAAPVVDRLNKYGMLAVDAPTPGDLLDGDQHTVMLVADLLAVAFASIRDRTTRHA
ncbi:MAG TPA: GAF domain-containing protein [Aldersonia sp.]